MPALVEDPGVRTPDGALMVYLKFLSAGCAISAVLLLIAVCVNRKKGPHER